MWIILLDYAVKCKYDIYVLLSENKSARTITSIPFRYYITVTMAKKGTISLFDGAVDASRRRNQTLYWAKRRHKEVFKLFGQYPLYWHKNAKIIQAAERLAMFKRFSDLQSAIEFAQAHRECMYCPKIYTPIHLEEKWSSLYHHKNNCTQA